MKYNFAVRGKFMLIIWSLSFPSCAGLHYTVDWSSVGSLLKFYRSPYMTL